MRVSRRQALGGAAAAAAAWAVGACARSGGGSTAAAPSPFAGDLTVPFQLWTPAVPVNATTKALIQEFVDANFNAKHKGIRATWVGGGNMTAVATSALAGAKTTPWVIASCCADWVVILPFLERLDPYLKTANIDSSTTWQAGQLSRFTEPDGLYGLPEDAASDAYLYRQDILDELGLPYPEPTWDWTAAAELWQRCSGRQKSGQWRYGASAPWSGSTTDGLPGVVAGFGGAFQNAERTICLLDSEAAISGGEYWFHLAWNRVCTGGGGYPNTGVFNGTCVFTSGAEPTILEAVQRLSQAKWDFLPWPSFPKRRVGNLHDNFFGILKTAPQKDIAWEILQWAAIEPDWQRFYMSLALAPPAVASLLEQWYAVMRATAPILKDKQLEYWGSPTLSGDGVYDFEFFRYEATNVNSIINNAWSQMWAQKIQITDGFRQITQQINALEAQGAAAARAQAAAINKFPTRGPAIAPVPMGI